MSRHDTVTKFPDDFVFEVTERFLDGQGASEVARDMKHRVTQSFTRETVYPTVREAVRRSFLMLSPPAEIALQRRLEEFPNQGDVRVVGASERNSRYSVPTVGARLVLDLIRDIGATRRKMAEKQDRYVHLGLGVGRTTMYMIRQLAILMRSESDVPPLKIHALATDHSFDFFENPISSMSYLRDAVIDIEFTGLFASPLLEANSYEDLKKQMLAGRAFAKADEIDIVITSLASSKDEHGYLYRYIQKFDKPDALARLQGRGWVGDLQLRPYNQDGPLPINEGMKPVTLFELDDLVAKARETGKHVVLLCSPCGHCGKLKTHALEPLMLEPRLHAWNHLVIDAHTAKALADRLQPA